LVIVIRSLRLVPFQVGARRKKEKRPRAIRQ
jgi:hypothetical protein